MATRSPGRTPRPSNPARNFPAASETSLHEWSVQTLSRLSFRNARALYFWACASKFCERVATRSGIRNQDLLFLQLAVVAQTFDAANRSPPAARRLSTLRDPAAANRLKLLAKYERHVVVD